MIPKAYHSSPDRGRQPIHTGRNLASRTRWTGTPPPRRGHSTRTRPPLAQRLLDGGDELQGVVAVPVRLAQQVAHAGAGGQGLVTLTTLGVQAASMHRAREAESRSSVSM